MNILGISAYYHDSAAALVMNGRIVAAAQEERFTRRKFDADFPRRAIEYCLCEGGLLPADIDRVVFYDKPFLKFERLLETYLAFAPAGFRSFRMAMPLWLREKLFLKSLLAKQLKELDPAVDWDARLAFTEHHVSHAASAFFPSPFGEAAILVMDGVGEWATTSIAHGHDNRLEVLEEIHFPHSLGLLYSAFTYYCGFRVNSGEYKLMGLAPYGRPTFVRTIRDRLIDLRPDGSFRLDMGYFDYCAGLTMTNPRFDALFGGPPRQPEQPLEQRHMDLAASVQVVLEEAVLALSRRARTITGSANLCMAGGVALNCVANGKLLREGIFDALWVQPAAGDAGGALGAALAGHYILGGAARVPEPSDSMAGAYLGPSFSQSEIETRLAGAGARFSSLAEGDMLTAAACALAEGKAVGWFQGRMEFGPRALGNRSILGDARNPNMQKSLNLKVKFRESFRPFAPAVLKEKASEWFDLDVESPYMLLVAEVLEGLRVPPPPGSEAVFGIDRLNLVRSSIPAVTHVDHSARVQTVDRVTNPLFHDLLSRFDALTGCPVLVNTSFNVRSEPIVATPEDAFRCFMGTDIEMLVAGRSVLQKSEQKNELARDYRHEFEFD